MRDLLGLSTHGTRSQGTQWKPRKLDCIHVALSLQEYVQGAYTTIVVVSDHNAVIVQLQQPPLQRVPPRLRFATKVLQDAECAHNFGCLLSGLGEATP